MRCYAQRTNYGHRVEVMLVDEREGLRAFGKLTLHQESLEGEYHEPTMALKPEEAQELMDALWQAGLRPSEGSGSAGSLRATERHLEDMRRLVFEDRTTDVEAATVP